jgi:hypothetical protein
MVVDDAMAMVPMANSPVPVLTFWPACNPMNILALFWVVAAFEVRPL